MARANGMSISRPHCGRARRSSYTEAPSLSHRGSRLFDSCSVMTWAISCHSVSPQLKLPGSRAFGESTVTTRPKQAPSAPIMPGRPSVRTAKSSCFGNISMRIGPFGVNSQRLLSAVERLLGQLRHVLPHHGLLVRMQPNDHVAFADGVERLERDRAGPAG